MPAPIDGLDNYRLATRAQIKLADEAEAVSANNRLLENGVGRDLTQKPVKIPACVQGDLVVVLKYSGMLDFSKSGDAEEIATVTVHKVGVPGDFGVVTLARPILTSDQRLRGVRAPMVIRSVDAAGKKAGIDTTKTPEVTLCGRP